MTTTVQDIIRGALSLIGVLDIGEAVPPDEAADGLAIFNDMVASWDSKGVHTGAPEVTLTDQSPLEDLHTKGLKNLLAVELAGPYGKSVPASVARDAMQGWQALEADFKVIETLQMDSAILLMPSQRRHW
jgi:hypothetical protein